MQHPVVNWHKTMMEAFVKFDTHLYGLRVNPNWCWLHLWEWEPRSTMSEKGLMVTLITLSYTDHHPNLKIVWSRHTSTYLQRKILPLSLKATIEKYKESKSANVWVCNIFGWVESLWLLLRKFWRYWRKLNIHTIFIPTKVWKVCVMCQITQ